ncbi:MAG: long-chain fatty acid--CoA ligase [Alicyclobacillaceae bacterium]|nr:long-chain fatty acid--CoA ligase [Alicyclobacillaceae bacterium]
MADNLLAMLAESVERHADRPALWQPDATGVFSRWTYTDLWRTVVRVGAQLVAAGVQPGDRIGLLAANGVWWPVADFAVMGAGAATVPVYPSAAPGQIRYVLRHSGVRAVIVENVERLQPLLAVEPSELPDVEFVVLIHPTAHDPGTHARALQAVAARWRVYEWPRWLAEAEPPDAAEEWHQRWRGLDRSRLATIVYTSGTTGSPKGAMLTHGNILSNVESVLSAVPLKAADRTLSYLPLSHIFERTAGQFVVLAAGGSIAYSRGIRELSEDFRRMPPDVLTTVPRLLEKMHEQVWAQVLRGPAWKQKLFERALAVGLQTRVRGQPTAKWRMALYDRLVFRKLQQATGGRLRMVVVGGAPLPLHIAEFFTAAGYTVVEGYGMTETSPVISVNRPERPHLGTAGPPVPGVEVRIADDGELWVRGPNVMTGYYQDEDATRQVMTADGWLRTGDIAERDADGCLRITDRKKHVIVLSTGKKVTPAPIEAEILRSPWIDQVMLVGQGRKFVSAVVVPSERALAAVGEAAAAAGGVFGAGKPEAVLAERLLGEVERYTAAFADFERPKRVIVAREPFTVENGMLTPTLKVRASAVAAAYAAEIDRLYESDSFAQDAATGPV